MEDILKGQIGSEVAYDLDFKGGKLIFTINYTGKQADAGLTAAVSVDLLLDKVKEKINKY